MTVQHEDSQLISRVRNGDIDALGELYERYRRQVYRTAVAITHDERMAEDVLQEAFLRVYRYADSFDQSQPFEPWLYRITVNLCYSWTNRAKRWVNFFQDAVERVKSPARLNPETVTEEREQWDVLRQAVDALPNAQRMVVILYYLEGLSLSEIAYVMSIPEGTVKSRLYYARKKLRQVMTEQGLGLKAEVAYDFA